MPDGAIRAAVPSPVLLDATCIWEAAVCNTNTSVKIGGVGIKGRYHCARNDGITRITELEAAVCLGVGSLPGRSTKSEEGGREGCGSFSDHSWC